MNTLRNHVLPALPVCIGLLVSGIVAIAGQQPAAGPFTADQAAAGRTAYLDSCAACHGDNLDGVPPLAGGEFRASWSLRTTRDLFSLIQATMPSDRPGSLPEQTYLGIVAYILQANGRTPGAQPLTATTSVAIGAGSPGTTPAAVAQGGAPAGRGAGGRGEGAPAGAPAGRGRGQAPAPPPLGVTVAGVVSDFVRVTDEMLRNPPPGDWPMLRRDQYASNFSPLAQITRDNVKDLQLAWVWPMHEGGTSQPAPLAHDGTIYPQQHRRHRPGDRRPHRRI